MCGRGEDWLESVRARGRKLNSRVRAFLSWQSNAS